MDENSLRNVGLYKGMILSKGSVQDCIDSDNNESDSTADKGSGNGMLLDGMEDPSSEDSDEAASELAPKLQEIKGCHHFLSFCWDKLIPVHRLDLREENVTEISISWHQTLVTALNEGPRGSVDCNHDGHESRVKQIYKGHLIRYMVEY